MIVNLDEYRNKKNNIQENVKKPVTKTIYKVPIFEKVYVEDNKLIGEYSNGSKEVIREYNKEN